MLRGSLFMVRGLHLDPHILQSQHHIASCVFSQIQRAHIQIARLFMGNRGRDPVVVRVEKEKFTLRVNIAGVSLFFSGCRCLFQDIARAFPAGFSVGTVKVADHPRHAALLRSPTEGS